MKFVIQRVTNAKCEVNHEITGAIEQGFCVLIGVAETDNEQIADKMIKKLLGMRIFSDGTVPQSEGTFNHYTAGTGRTILVGDLAERRLAVSDGKGCVTCNSDEIQSVSTGDRLSV